MYSVLSALWIFLTMSTHSVFAMRFQESKSRHTYVCIAATIAFHIYIFKFEKFRNCGVSQAHRGMKLTTASVTSHCIHTLPNSTLVSTLPGGCLRFSSNSPGSLFAAIGLSCIVHTRRTVDLCLHIPPSKHRSFGH